MLPSLKQRILSHLILIIGIVTIVESGVFFWVQKSNAERRAQQNAAVLFRQIETILAANEEELESVKKEYGDDCLSRAEAVAYILDHNPDAAESCEEMRQIAAMVGVDEIHIFDEKGTITSGTNPEYYGVSMADGEQIGYFQPMLTDRSLRLMQDVEPNTAEGKMMQYSAVWNKSETFILQVGRNPSAVMRATAKNELNYIFGLLNGGTGVEVYALDTAKRQISGSSNENALGLKPEEIGFDESVLSQENTGMHQRIDGIPCYCVTTVIGRWTVVYTVTNESMYQNLSRNAAFLTAAVVLIAVVLIFMVMQYIDRFVIRSIHGLNEELSGITAGKLDQTVRITGSREFSELSAHINEMVRSLVSNTEKISYILNQTGLPVGVYEYSHRTSGVWATERVPALLKLSQEDADALFADWHKFEAHIEKLKTHWMKGEDNLYAVEGNTVCYIRLEERREEGDVFGVVVDMTDEILRRRRIESERDVDMLTGVLSRRALKAEIQRLFERPGELKHGLLCMIDADGLKGINDSYGHIKGDRYLQEIADCLQSFGSGNNLTGRLGGDEFVMFLYGYETEDMVDEEIEKLRKIQDSGMLNIDGDRQVPIRLSLGYSRTYGETDSHALLLHADETMYQNKSERKRRNREEQQEQ